MNGDFSLRPNNIINYNSQFTKSNAPNYEQKTESLLKLADVNIVLNSPKVSKIIHRNQLQPSSQDEVTKNKGIMGFIKSIINKVRSEISAKKSSNKAESIETKAKSIASKLNNFADALEKLKTKNLKNPANMHIDRIILNLRQRVEELNTLSAKDKKNANDILENNNSQLLNYVSKFTHLIPGSRDLLINKNGEFDKAGKPMHQFLRDIATDDIAQLQHKLKK